MATIVICDDEIHIRQGLKKYIEQAPPNLQVAGVAANGPAALQLIRQVRPDIALMDINMPGISGLDVVQQVCENGPACRFVIISGYDEFAYARKALRLGAVDYLLKPIDHKELLRVLQGIALPAAPTTPPQPTLADQIKAHIGTHFTDPALSLTTLATQFHLSESYLSRIIKKECGTTYSEYLNRLRIAAAQQLLLQDPAIQSQEVADRVGYLNKHYFCRVFKRQTGLCPTDYQKAQTRQNKNSPC